MTKVTIDKKIRIGCLWIFYPILGILFWYGIIHFIIKYW
jgi:phosphate/sulfate permease